MKIRFIEPGNLPFRHSPLNFFVYDKYIRTPSNGQITLATIVKKIVDDTYMYSESISKIKWNDVFDADIIFFSIFTFNANRGYELAEFVRRHSKALIVFGGLHATLNYKEAAEYCDYVLVGEGDETIVKFIEAVHDKKPIDFAGVYSHKNGVEIFTGEAPLPMNIDTIPDRNLLYKFKQKAGINTIWPQVHASRGCPHNCDYCALVAAFGRKVRVRSPENVMQDIENAIEFFDKGHHRLAKVLWITDDNFFADREWAISVLQLMIERKFKYSFTIQARYEVGFDDEILELLRRANFSEIAMGIEFLEDEAFEKYHKKSTRSEILRSVKNIQKHGLRVRGLFILGADNHTHGVGERLADFVIEHNICGVLLQSMYFIPGTPVYETHKNKLINHDWSRCVGKVVHFPEKMSPTELEQEIINASKKIYSVKRLINAIFHKKGLERILFVGEFFWQKSVRSDLKKDMIFLKSIEQKQLDSKTEKVAHNV